MLAYTFLTLDSEEGTPAYRSSSVVIADGSDDAPERSSFLNLILLILTTMFAGEENNVTSA